jgi:lysozyme
MVALVLGGCGADASRDADQDRAAGQPERTGEIASAETVCAGGETVEGIDVSVWQASVDWPAVKGDGIAFAVARVSYGVSKDDWFDTNWSGIRSAGLVRGTYQYFLADEDAIDQANVMLDAIGALEAGDLPPILDVETLAGQSPATVVDKMSQWLTHVEAAIGRKPIIYTGKYFWQDNIASDAFTDYPLWIPNYSFDCPNLPDGYWNNWVLFQYTDSGSVSGVDGNVDRNLFNGSLDDLLKFASGGSSYGAEFVSQSFPYASDGPATVQAGETLEASIVMRNVGTATWDELTHLAATEPRDRTSPFAGPEWPAANRYARVTGAVPPGETYEFKFTLHAPLETGTYDEHFGLVQEGVTWFSDPGQGGPPDGQLQGLFEVLPGDGTSTQNGSGSAGGQGGSGGSGSSDDDPGTSVSCATQPGTGGAAPIGFTVLLGLGLAALGRRRARKYASPLSIVGS